MSRFDTQTHKFTGNERDAETELDHTWFRKYNFSFGRWMTPDPAGLAAVNPAFPQSWNRYAYVLNNPLSFIDPSGLDCIYFNADGTVNFVKPGDCYSDTDDGFFVDGTVVGGKSGISLSQDNNWIVFNLLTEGWGMISQSLCVGYCPDNSVTVSATDPNVPTWNPATTGTLTWNNANVFQSRPLTTTEKIMMYISCLGGGAPENAMPLSSIPEGPMGSMDTPPGSPSGQRFLYPQNGHPSPLNPNGGSSGTPDNVVNGVQADSGFLACVANVYNWPTSGGKQVKR